MIHLARILFPQYVIDAVHIMTAQHCGRPSLMDYVQRYLL